MKAVKIQIYPTREQATLIDKTIGCCRFVYNQALAKKKTAYETDKTSISSYSLIKQLPQQKQELEWLKEVDSISLQQSILDLDKAYKRFFKERNGFPNFHKKGRKDSYRTLNASKLSRHYVNLPKIGEVKTAERLLKKWQFKNATVSKQAGKYFVAVLIEYIPCKAKKAGESVGIDLGIKDFAILSNGERIANPKTTAKYADRLALLQRRLSHTQKGSNNRWKARLAVSRLHLRIANTRCDFLNKTSSAIAKRYSVIALETLNTSGMLKNHDLAKSIADVSWSEFVRQLEYKIAWYGGDIKRIGQFEPSSKLCGICGYKNDSLTLKDREWTCPNCGTNHDRDLNAANNILKIALADSEVEPVDTCGISRIEQENLLVTM